MLEDQVALIPNAARVYDFLLGGTHNFEADREAAKYMMSLLPSTGKWVRRLRAFMHEAVLELANEGFDQFLDLASGLPTREHIHATVPHARVVYVDNDPVVAVYGTEILGNNPNARYVRADIRNLAAILESPAVRELLDSSRKVAIGFNAVSCFLTEGEIGNILHMLYHWAGPGSKVLSSFETKTDGAMTPKLQQFLAMFDNLGSPYHFVTRERAAELIRPWTHDARGFRPLSEMHSTQDPIAFHDREDVGLEFYGVILQK